MLNPSNVRHWCSGGSSTLGSIFESISLAGRLFAYTIKCYLLSHPLILRLGFAIVRRVRPVAIVGNQVVVAKAKDVREVLDRLADFTEDLGPRIPWGPFLITVDWPEQHARERELLQSVVSKLADVTQIRNAAATLCRAQIAQARSAGRIDVVKDLCKPVLIDTIQEYFGIPTIGSPDDMAIIIGRVASFIMVEPPVGSARRIESLDSIARLSRTIVDQIDLIKGLPASRTVTGPDLLTRLVAKLNSEDEPTWFDEGWIRRYMTGLAVFGGGTIIRATTQAIDQLIRYPDDLQEARALAAEIESLPVPGRSSPVAQHRIEAARESLLQIIYEALRFRPMLPILSRYVPRETIVAKDTAHARLVPTGATVLAPPIAAMFDPEEFPNPRRFSRTRCLKRYVHFGYGSRLCFGKYIADVLMVEIFRALLRCDELKRAAGSSGRVAYDGAAVRSLVLTFRP
jgi:cytochrome P450